MSQRAERTFMAIKVLGAFFRPKFWKAVKANRQAVKAGRERPHDVMQLIADGFDMGSDAYNAIKRRK